MNTTDAGRLGEAKVIARLTELGWYLFSDLSGKCPVDLLAWKDNQVIRIQVKTSGYSPNQGSYEVKLSSIRPNRTGNTIKKLDANSIDYLAIYLSELDEVCFVPSEQLGARTTVAIKVGPGSRSKFVLEDLLEL
jgi:hypothetical protein